MNNIPASSAHFYSPAGITFDALGNLYIADAGYNIILKIDASIGIISTVAGESAGGGGGYTCDNCAATSSELAEPQSVAIDGAGNLYIADTRNSLIRKVVAGTGIITTVAGLPPF